ncbi:hypothetical protein BpHYR1_042160 [Brachionus plicatilis]|uniref:Uncharacterized protein n=1 Tax=Brachionus plicatilis TaxID=10195 RepID=A0A3M7QGP0_BRAPC|nr:hypothetical protein BpHYR1_042160 [Brachionus plicatilis]
MTFIYFGGPLAPCNSTFLGCDNANVFTFYLGLKVYFLSRLCETELPVLISVYTEKMQEIRKNLTLHIPRKK